MSLRLDYFIDPSVKVYQDPDQFCFNTDSFLLAKFCRVHPGDSVLEIGCNNGALLVWLDQFKPGPLTGVEILPAAAELALKNAAEFISSDVRIIQGDIRNTDVPLQDVILCNPPFFKADQFSKTEPTARDLGRFEFNLDLDSCIQEAAKRLKSGGHFFLVHRPERLADIARLFERYGLGLSRIQPVYDARTNRASSLLVEGVKDRNPDVLFESPLMVGGR